MLLLEPSHGPPGSGLKPFVYIDEALTHITRQGPRAMNDPYHKPKLYTNPRPALQIYIGLCVRCNAGVWVSVALRGQRAQSA